MKLAKGTNDALRAQKFSDELSTLKSGTSTADVKSSSFAETESSSFPLIEKSPSILDRPPTGNKDVDDAMDLIREYVLINQLPLKVILVT